LHGGESFTVIAGLLGKATSTVPREVSANGGGGAYRRWRAHQRARWRVDSWQLRRLGGRPFHGTACLFFCGHRRALPLLFGIGFHFRSSAGYCMLYVQDRSAC
jgi:hypothetical protein